MSTLTYMIAIPLPDDEFDRAEIIANCSHLAGSIADMLTDKTIVGTVSHSFDGRKARSPKANGAVDASAGAGQMGAAVE